MWKISGRVRCQEFEGHLCSFAVSSKAQFTEMGHCAKQDFLKIHLQGFISVALSLKIQRME